MLGIRAAEKPHTEPTAAAAAAAAHSRQCFTNCLLTYFAYAAVMSCRRALSVAKNPLEEQRGVRASSLGALDTAMLLAYLAMQLLQSSSTLMARLLPLPPKSLIIIAVAGSGLATAATAREPPSVSAMAPAWVLNGLLQASLYPQICLLLNDGWLEPQSRGRSMALWNTSVAFGAIISAAASAVAVPARGWKGAFEAPAVLALLGALAVALGLTSRPPPTAAAATEEAAAAAAAEMEAASETEAAAVAAAETEVAAVAEVEAAIAAARAHSESSPLLDAAPCFKLRGPSAERYAVPAWRMEMVPSIGLAHLLIKPIRFLFLWWGTYYQLHVLGLSLASAGLVESCGTVGGIAGGVAAGVLTDRLPIGAVFAPTALLLALTLAAFPHVAALSFGANIAVYTLAFALLGALDNLGSGLTGAVIIDQHEREHNGVSHASIASIVAFIAALGSVGTLVQAQLVTRLMEAPGGWRAIFWMTSAQAVLAAVALLHVALRQRGGN